MTLNLPRLDTRLAFACCLLAGLAMETSAAEDPVTEFERKVRPILEERCFECHGSEKQKGGLRLDQKAGLFGGGESGEPAVVPGKSGESPLIKLVSSTDPDESMPPKGKRLEPGQIATLKQWIDRGAHWPQNTAPEETEQTARGMVITDQDREFWAFQPPRRGEAKPEGNWARQPLDRFIRARLAERELEPSPEAPRAVFLRRLSFDLTGLPPAPEEVDGFLNDTGPNADERVVDRLLASTRFGERMASSWLPLARFAEDQA
nr:DUF1549 domain-containing protein [Verrucomicrobiota bacterium]